MRIRKIWLLLIAVVLLGTAGLYVLFRVFRPPGGDPWVLYDHQYFEERHLEPVRSSARVVPELMNLLSPRSVVDVGCGLGEWLAEFQKHGVTDVRGIDGPWVDRRMLNFPPQLFLSPDLSTPLTLERKFDLAVSLEVAEHLPPERAEGFVSDLVALAPVVFFSANIPYAENPSHINLQWQDYWARIFAKFGYVSLDYLRYRFWEDNQVQSYYRQDMILYAKRDYIETHPPLQAILAQSPTQVLPLVHPEYWIRFNQEPGLRWLLRRLPGATARAIQRRLRGLLGSVGALIGITATSPFPRSHPMKGDRGVRRLPPSLSSQRATEATKVFEEVMIEGSRSFGRLVDAFEEGT